MADEHGAMHFPWQGGTPPATVDEAARAFRSAGRPEGALPDFLHAVGADFARRGNAAEAERALRRAINAGNPLAYGDLGVLLAGRPGREREAEQALRAAIAAGERDYNAYEQRTPTLSSAERDAAIRRVTRTVRAATAACTALGVLLTRQPGRDAEAESAFRAALAVGDHAAAYHLGILLARQPGRAPEAEQLLRQASGARVPSAAAGLAAHLMRQPGREAEAERLLREAAQAGDPEAARALDERHSPRDSGAGTSAGAGEAPGASGVCPACGGGRVLPIIYGAPNEIHMQMVAARALTPGGAMGRLLSGDAPQWDCAACGHRWRGGLFAGGQGNTPADAVVVTGIASTVVGIRIEKQYLTERFGLDDAIAGAASGWHQEEQQHFAHDGRHYDRITVRLPNGTRRAVWFDISAFFGAWP